MPGGEMASGSGDAVPMEDRVKGDGKNDRPKEKERMTKESLRASPKRTRLAITREERAFCS